MGGDILLHPDNVRDSAAAGDMALRDSRRDGDQRQGAPRVGDHHHVPQLRVRAGYGVAALH